MKEFEAKFTGFTLTSARDLLAKHGYSCTSPERMMTRKAFHIKGNTNKWARIRDEGDKITLTIKEIVESNNISGVNEAEVEIHSFEEGSKVLEMCNFFEASFQETKREAWHKGEIEVVIDTWPGISPFIEVEGSSAQSVENACIELGLDMDEALYGGVDVIYTKELGTPADFINNLPIITFDNPPKLDSTYYLGKLVTVKVDRPLNSIHPKHKNIIYKLNYGYIPDTVSGDGEELDAYIIGVKEPVTHFEGMCIALIRRTEEDDDKLVIVPNGIELTDEEIREKTAFQEQFFKSDILRET